MTTYKRRRQFFRIFDTPLTYVGSFLVLSVVNFDQFLTLPLPNERRCLWTAPKSRTQIFEMFDNTMISKIWRHILPCSYFGFLNGVYANIHSGHVVDYKKMTSILQSQITCSWHQKNETTNSPIHEFKVLQNVF